ncbi:hypothetical protein BRD09_08110 [Halobacteriales archaeon SW_10_68_16]|jgi:hypothetical protein|nr:MAG: hypothetical protein BRD09_08110 [Halobacteriales archaeon SW_10_68_16]
MESVLAGVRRLCWNAGENRLRALFRVPVVLGLALLAAQLITTSLGRVRDLLGFPTPLFATVQFGVLTGALVWWLRQTGEGVAIDGTVAVPDLWSGDRAEN